MWQLLFWVSLALLVYIYVGYPVALAALGRLRARARSTPPDSPLPSVCLIISAHDEEAVIREKIENSLRLVYDGLLSVVVASDGSADRTNEIAREYHDHGVELMHWPARRGKSAVLNEVVRARREDVLVFTDANALFAPDAVARLAERFRTPSVGCVVGELKYARDASTVGQGESLYWRYESLVKSLESRIESVLVANGAIFAARRSWVRELFLDVANDFQIPFDVAARGAGVVYEPSAVAIERTAELWEEEFGRKVRIVLRGITGYVRLHRRMHALRAWQFVSHKLLRWSVGVILLVVLASSVALAGSSPWFAAFLGLQLVCYAAAVAAWLVRRRRDVPRVLYVPFYFTMVNAAALVALGRFVAGGRQATWEKAASTRATPPRGLEAGGVGSMPVAMAERGARRRLVEK
ncbi:MAG TPA: glycosyltransferase family 2 protein [Candidatus Krumholzibacteria bacterium]|nr:glycosyltransferase family 2 protein [Candidatus Krumholzibacteria bacterium]